MKVLGIILAVIISGLLVFFIIKNVISIVQTIKKNKEVKK